MKQILKSGVLSLLLLAIVTMARAITINSTGGWLESAYVEFSLDSNYDGYNVYVKGGQYSAYTKLDAALVRKYTDHGRADALGLKGGNSYTFKVVPTNGGTEDSSAAVESSAVSVKAHDRSGFAFKGSQTPGAYNSDGTLKSGAVVIYVTNSNKNTLKANIIYTSKGVYQNCVGILAVLTALKKGYETRPIDIRVIGDITADDQVLCDLTTPTTTTSIASAKDFKGDWMISTNKKDCGGITVEGVGNDAVANGWGIRFKSLNYGECRNLGFMNCHSDEGDNIGLQQDNNYCWVHNCDMFYGDAGSDADQVKGDGALDCKKSNYITLSYNHFWDNGKCNLLGLSEGVNSYASSPYYITYHHNWYDHSDSRHPRCRYYNAHVYNNYYDGNAKYGAGSCLASSVFMEGNYFRACKFPMMTSMQGSDVYSGTTTRDIKNNPTFSKEDGGMIKAYNNYMTGNCTFIPYGASEYLLKGVTTAIGSIDSKADFDAYVVTDKSTMVPSIVTSYAGANYYSNFDTKPFMYSYTAEEPADAKETVTGSYGAGRMQHGDFTWTFSSSDDAVYAVDTNLKSALASYTNSDLVGLFSDDTSSSESGTETKSSDATLSKLTVSSGTLSPAFSSSITEYSVTLPAGTTTVPMLSATANDNGATVTTTNATKFTDNAATSYVKVTAADGTTKTYTVNFTVLAASSDDDATLASLTLSTGTLSPSFSSSTTTYSVILPNGTTTVPTVSVTASNSGASINIVNGTIADSKATTTVTVTAADGKTTKTYTINFTVAAAGGSEISSAMTFNFGENTYKSYFTAGTDSVMNTGTGKGTATYNGTDYTTCIKMESKTSMHFTTTKAFTMVFGLASTQTGAILVDGKKVSVETAGSTASVELPAGNHIIKRSTSGMYLFFLDFKEAGSTQSSDATLKSLAVKGYALAPSFTASNKDYEVELDYGTTAVPTITYAVNDSKASASLNTSACKPAGTAVVTVKAEDGSTVKYSILFTVAGAPTESSDATLKALSVEGYSLTPDFDAATSKYYVVLDSKTTEVPAITATKNDDDATVSIDTEGCTPAGQAVITVTAQDGTESNYYINFSLAADEELVFPYSGSFYTVTGSTSTSKGSITYNGITYSTCLKMENKTSVTFTTAKAATLTLVMGAASNTITVDGTQYTADDKGVITISDLTAGDHTISKAGAYNLYYGGLNYKSEVFTITYAGCEGQVTNSNPTSYNSDEGLTLTDPARAGYDFAGWTYDGQTEPVNPVTIAAGTTGDMTFTAHWSPKTVTVTTLSCGWASFGNMTFDENVKLVAPTDGHTTPAQAYICSDVTSETAVMKPVDVIAEYDGVFIKGDANTTYTLQVTSDEPTTSYERNYIIGVAKDTEISSDAYILASYKSDNTVSGLFLVDTKVTVPAGKAYIDVPTTLTSPAKHLTISISDDSMTAVNGVHAIANTITNSKYIKNGRVLIVKDGKEYNTTGVRIK